LLVLSGYFSHCWILVVWYWNILGFLFGIVDVVDDDDDWVDYFASLSYYVGFGNIPIEMIFYVDC
jgi:hypothetical protein